MKRKSRNKLTFNDFISCKLPSYSSTVSWVWKLLVMLPPEDSFESVTFINNHILAIFSPQFNVCIRSDQFPAWSDWPVLTMLRLNVTKRWWSTMFIHKSCREILYDWIRMMIECDNVNCHHPIFTKYQLITSLISDQFINHPQVSAILDEEEDECLQYLDMVRNNVLC